MKRVNIIYDNEYNDVDIICVPDRAVKDVEELGNQFFQWIEEHPGPWHKVTEDGMDYIEQDTDLFLYWANTIWRNIEEPRCSLIKAHLVKVTAPANVLV